ncbi:putative toxin-antitoxin system toxin component, PIN family [bacterium]|nr:putative toxin-antitoxin system toxin component, PIN family [bacterium]
MKIVLDTNVLVSGLLNAYSASGEILQLVASGSLDLCYNTRILSEYRDVLLRLKFSFDKVHVESLLDQIEFCGHIVAARPLKKRLPDPDDEPFLEVALEERAQCLVTGNLRHFPTELFNSMNILSPSDFLEYYRENREMGAGQM